jgi:hypothetical protein
MEEILKRLYESKPLEENVANESDDIKLTQRMDLVYGQGVLKFHKGAAYPDKGLAEPIALAQANFAKKLLVHTARLYINPYQAIKFIFSNKTKFINQILDTYNELSLRVMDKIIHIHFMPPPARNLRIFTTKFLQRINVDQRIANEFSKIISNIIALDNAYLLRLQDIASETTHLKLTTNPRKELLRLLSIYKQRDHSGISKKILVIKPLISIALLIPKYKRAFIDSINDIDLSEMQFDEADLYWVAQSPAYPFLGKTLKERAYLLEGKTLPDIMTRTEWERISQRHDKSNIKNMVQIHTKRNKRNKK